MCFLRLKNRYQAYIAGIMVTFRLLFVIYTKCAGNTLFLSLFYFPAKTVHIMCYLFPVLFYSGYLFFIRIKIRVTSQTTWHRVYIQRYVLNVRLYLSLSCFFICDFCFCKNGLIRVRKKDINLCSSLLHDFSGYSFFFR